MWSFVKENQDMFKILIAVIFTLIAAVLLIVAYRFEKKRNYGRSGVQKMTMISILAAMSVVLYYFPKLPISFIFRFMPDFLDLHLSNVPILIAGFLFGPTSGVAVAVLRMLVKLPNSTTLGVGELMDVIIGTLTVLATSMIYHKYHTKKSSILSLVVMVFVWMITAVITNWLLVLPFYIELYTFEGVYGMLSIIPGITRSNYMGVYLVVAIVPFNLILSTLVAIVTFVIYKRISKIYRATAYKNSTPKD